ncbi:MAG: acyl-CoA mutase large subunit family protein [Vicinamibacterales bacterium]
MTSSKSPPCATPDDLSQADFDEHIGNPGLFPFTRGIQPDMYRGRPWTMRQYAGFATAAESNRRFRYLLARGVTGLSVAFDLPTQIGYDSDHPLAAGEVGRVGVAIDSIEDMAVLLDGIPLDRVSTSMTINATAIILLALYAAVATRHGTPIRALSGTLQNDILKEYVARGTYIYPPRPSLRIVTDVMAFCAREMPHWNPISVSGYHIREAGATAVQEVAFTLAHGCAYVQAGIDAGLDVDEFGQRISFFFNAHNDFLEEIAKFRAARRLWAAIMRDRFGATSPRAQQLRFHTQTAGSTLTAQQPDNNIVRVALQALAAVLGGTQSLHCNARDEALALPTEESATIALRTQQVILHESGVAHTADPVGGAYAIEALTDRIEREARDVLAAIDAQGGALAAVESGYVQQQIQEVAYRAQQTIDSGEAIVVGMNRFATPDDARAAAAGTVFLVDPEAERRQIERVRAVRGGRSEQAWRDTLAAVERAARDGSNLVAPIMAAVDAHATLGEIADTLRRVFGEYQDSSGA